jgi:hypothetical protein
MQGEKLVPVGMFRSEEGWVQVDYGTGNIPIPRSKYEEKNTSPISINCRQKRSIWMRRKRRKMMPRGPKGEKQRATLSIV